MGSLACLNNKGGVVPFAGYHRELPLHQRSISDKEERAKLDVVIENCRNINHGVISIDVGKLNIKIAPNGTGKSSVAKALVAAIENSDGPKLIPFGELKDGLSAERSFRVSGMDGISSVEAFDESYVQSVVFQQDDLFPGSFDVFVKSPEFVDTEAALRGQLQSMVGLAERQDIRKLTADLEAFRTNLVGSSGLDRKQRPKASAPVIKALEAGNTWVHEDPLLSPFKPMLGSGPFKKWVTWHRQGSGYLSLTNGVCPYCGQDSSEAQERVCAVDNAFSSAMAGNVEKVLEAVSIGNAYMSAAAIEGLNGIADSADPITDQAKGFVGKLAQDAQLILDALTKLRTVASYFDLSGSDDLENRLRACRISIELVDSFKSNKCCEIASEINEAVEATLASVDRLKFLVNKQKALLSKSIEKSSKEINTFLAMAGYPYAVKLHVADDGTCSVKLIHASSWVVTDAKEALSYGERNAFALIFFAYECMRRKPDLIILDDPISSFDGAKRYALLNMLFLGGIGEASLKGKTTLLLTHDYGTLFDVEHTHKSAFQPLAKSCILSCTGGELTEVRVTGNDMILAGSLYKGLAKNSAQLMTKLIYSRKTLEMEEDKGNAYDVVSSLFHHRAVPTLRDGTPMDAAEISAGIARLTSIVGEEVDYAALLKVIDNPTEMLALFDAARSNYEKLQIARISIDAKLEDDVLKERMDDSVHIGNGFLYQLDPTRYELVPESLVNRCREEILALTATE